MYTLLVVKTGVSFAQNLGSPPITGGSLASETKGTNVTMPFSLMDCCSSFHSISDRYRPAIISG